VRAVKRRLLGWRRPASPELQAMKAQARAEREERRAKERAAEASRRQDAAARRRQVAGELAAAALAWGPNAWLEGAMWLCLFGGLVVLYIGSYSDLMATFAAFGYDGHISWLMPLGIDLPVTASVLAQMLAGRWKCHWWVRVRLGLLTAVTAPLTLTGNALRGAIDAHGHFTFTVQLWMDLAAFAVPGLGVVLIGYVASMMQGERAELQRRRLEAEASWPPVEGGEHQSREGGGGAGVRGEREARPATRSKGAGRSGRVPANEVLAMVRGARDRLVGELEREPSDNDVAALVTSGGHPISASRTRMYLAQLRAAEQTGEAASAVEEG
jgi:hypothetical protein